MRFLVLTLAVALLLTPLLPTSAAAAGVPIIDYLGFGWEDGGIPPSNPADVLTYVGTASTVNPVLGIDLGTTEVTLYAHDLVSTGQTVDGSGNLNIGYAGGTLEIRMDGAMNADYGVFPPNATVPSTFGDGTLLFQGSFSSFVVVITPSGAGAFEGHLDGLTGMILDTVCTDCGYTWGGAFTSAAGAQLPDGYDLQLDGVFEVDEAIPAQPRAWGSVKALYNN